MSMFVKAVFAFSILAAFPVLMFSQGMMGNRIDSADSANTGSTADRPKKVDAVLTEIRQNLGLKESEKIDPDKVKPGLLEELGDSVMEAMIGNPDLHDRMDNMMGGDGSVTLSNFHKQIAYRYLSGLPIGMMGPLGGGMMYGGMMGGGGYGYNPNYGYMMGPNGGGYYPGMPMLSFGSTMGFGPLMDMNSLMDYRVDSYLNLNQDQSAKISDIRIAFEKESLPLKTELLEKRKQLFSLWSAANLDEKAIAQTEKEASGILAELSEKETKYRIQMLKVLSPEQRKKLNPAGSSLARQATIHEKGAQVMPFSLDLTTHIFKLTDNGGIQQVIVKNPEDKSQISMIREHLRAEAQRFSKGDFSDPAALHGKSMPGLAELEKGAAKISISYSDLTNGGQITYSSTDKILIAAIHNWFQAQLSDHGNDAREM